VPSWRHPCCAAATSYLFSELDHLSYYDCRPISTWLRRLSPRRLCAPRLLAEGRCTSGLLARYGSGTTHLCCRDLPCDEAWVIWTRFSFPRCPLFSDIPNPFSRYLFGRLCHVP